MTSRVSRHKLIRDSLNHHNNFRMAAQAYKQCIHLWFITGIDLAAIGLIFSLATFPGAYIQYIFVLQTRQQNIPDQFQIIRLRSQKYFYIDNTGKLHSFRAGLDLVIIVHGYAFTESGLIPGTLIKLAKLKYHLLEGIQPL
jgi:hypothetical protein